MTRSIIARAAFCAALAASAAACESPSFTATGQFAAQKGPACVYCSGGYRDYTPPRMTDRTPLPATQGELSR